MQTDLLLTIDDLVTALIEHDYYRRYGPYFSDYYRTKRDLLLVLFACNIQQRKLEKDSEPQRRPRDHGGQTAFRFMRDEHPEDSYAVNGDLTVQFMQQCIKLASQEKTPFNYVGWLAGLPPRIARDLRERYGAEIRKRAEQLDHLYHAMIKDVLVSMFPGIETKTFPISRLYERGLPQEKPDPMEYF